MRKRVPHTYPPLTLLAAVYLLGLIARSPAMAQSITVVDDTDTAVTLATPARRIVALAPHITELLFAAGAGEQVVAVVDFSDYPPAARALPQLGSAEAVSYEAILALDPDLVVAWLSGNGRARIGRLRALGLTVFANEPGTLVAVADALETFGALAGTSVVANQAAAVFRAEYAALAAKYSTLTPVKVFYQVWDKPLTSLNGGHLISDVIRLCGGRNVFAEAIPLAPQVSIEAVIHANPDVIVASGMARPQPEWLRGWQAWPAINAVATGELHFIPPDLLQRHTPRVLEGARLLCSQLEQARNRLP